MPLQQSSRVVPSAYCPLHVLVWPDWGGGAATALDTERGSAVLNPGEGLRPGSNCMHEG